MAPSSRRRRASRRLLAEPTMTSPTRGRPIVLRGQHHRDRGTVPPAKAGWGGQLTGGSGPQQLTQRGFQQRQYGLGLRIS